MLTIQIQCLVPESTPGFIVQKQQNSIGDAESNMVLKSMGRVTRSAKQRAPVAPQYLGPTNTLEKKRKLFQKLIDSSITFIAVFCQKPMFK